MIDLSPAGCRGDTCTTVSSCRVSVRLIGQEYRDGIQHNELEPGNYPGARDAPYGDDFSKKLIRSAKNGNLLLYRNINL